MARDQRPIIVTGGAGFIGSHIVDRFHVAGRRVVVLDDLSSGSPSNVPDDVELIEIDLSEPGAREVIARLGPTLLVHAAAQASVPRSADDPFRDAEVNVLGAINVFLGARDASAERIVYLNSGGAMYGQADTIPTPEDAPIRPQSPYGLSKWMAEEYMRVLSPPACVAVSLRLANVYGPRQSADAEGGVVAVFGTQMLSGDPIQIQGDGLQTRDFVYVDDVVAAVDAASRIERSVALNIGTGHETTILDLFELMSAATSFRGGMTHAPAREDDIRRSALATAFTSRALGWRPTTEVAGGIARTLAGQRA